MRPVVAALLLAACADSQQDAVLPEAPPPPAPLAPAPCAPGSVFELGGAPYATLQGAVDQAGPGDEVVICAGAVTLGAVTVTANDFIVRGETGDPADVVLTDGALSFVPGLTSAAALHGVTLAAGATLAVSTAAPFTLADVVVRDHEAAEDVAVSLGASDVDLYRVRVTNNRNRIGLFVEPVVASARTRLWDVVFDHNELLVWALSIEPAATPGSVTLAHVRLEDNRTVNGVPLVSLDAAGRVVARDVTIARNLLSGAAIEIWEDAGDGLLEGLTVTDNVQDYPVLYWSGSAAPSTLQHSVFLRNTSPYVGPSWTDLGPVGALFMTLRLRDVDFGTGVDANEPFDIGGCLNHLGHVSRGRIRWGSFCP